MADDNQELLGRMEQLEQLYKSLQETVQAGFQEQRKAMEKFDEALRGGYDGAGGLVDRMRTREYAAHNHDLRITSLETDMKQKASKKDVEENTRWRKDLTAQWRLLMFLGSANFIGLVALIIALARLATNGG